MRRVIRPFLVSPFANGFVPARVALITLLLAPACGNARLSPAELAAALTEHGVNVQKKEVPETGETWPGSEMSVDLILDYDEPYKAVRFQSGDLARSYCQTNNMGVLFRSWCVYPVRRDASLHTWHKVDDLATK